ncbi:MAG: hypothetical protein ACK4IK_03720 [Bacteroidia bacterium]
MLKKQFILLLSLFTLHLFLSQTLAFVISGIFKSNSIELSNKRNGSTDFSFEEFNISTHANIWSLSKDENNKEETNLEIFSAFCNELYHQILSYFSIKNCNISLTFHAHSLIQIPVYLFIGVFRL